MDRNSVRILGFPVDCLTMDEAADYACTHSGQIVTINPEMISAASKNPEFAKVITDAELVVPDGAGVEIGLKILGHKVKRIPGIELGKLLIIKFSKEKKPIAMIGAKREVLEKAVENLKSEIPGINIVYSCDGYFENNDEVMKQIINSKPALVLAALGSPKQEFFISSLKQKLPDAVLIGLGGSFDVWAGTVNRAPAVYQKLGLEWLYRTIREPRRLKRIFPALPLFVLKVCKERLSVKEC